MKKNKGFTLVELLVCIVIVSIMILTIGVLSDIGNTGYNKASNTESIYNDISYAFKLIRNKVRSSESMKINSTPANPPWISSQLLYRYNVIVGGIPTLTEGAFGLYQTNVNSTKALVYVPDTSIAFNCDSNTNCETILSVPSNQTLNLTFPGTATDVNINSVTIKLNGGKNKIKFDTVNSISRRSS